MIASNAPTWSFRRHHDVDPPRVDASTFRQGWRIRSRLDALYVAEQLTAGEWQAAQEFRMACDRVRGVTGHTAPDLRASGAGHSGGAHDAMLGMVATTARLRVVDRYLGPLFSLLCVQCCVHDVSWAHLGRVVGVDPKTAQTYTVTALRRLGVVWIATAARLRGGQDAAGAFAAPIIPDRAARPPRGL